MARRVSAVLAIAALLQAQQEPGAGADTSQPETLIQVQSTLRRLQSEIRALQKTLSRLTAKQKKQKKPSIGKAVPQIAPQAPSAQVPSANLPTVAVLPKSDLASALADYNKGRELEDQRLFRQAIEAYSSAIVLDQKNDAAFLHRAMSYYQTGDHTSAIADFSTSLAIQSNQSRAYIGRATARAAMGQIAPALEDISEALLRNSTYADAYLLRAQIYDRQGEADKAVAEYSTLLSFAPNSEKALLGRAAAHLHAGATQQAQVDCEEVSKINPISYGVYLCLAQVHLQNGNPDRAVAELGRAVGLAQTLDQPLDFLTDTWKGLQRTGPGPTAGPQPTATAQPSAGTVPPTPVESQPTTVSAAGNPVPIAAPEPVAALPPPAMLSGPRTFSAPPPMRMSGLPQVAEAPGLERIARIRLAARQFEAAIPLLDRALTLDPELATAYNARGFSHLRLRRYAEAAGDFSKAIQLRPSYANAFHNRSVALNLGGNRPAAYEDARRAAELMPQLYASALNSFRN